MEDLTQYSDQELSLRVFNTEWLYRMRSQNALFEALDGAFIYTEEQKEILIQDLKDDEEEEEEEIYPCAVCGDGYRPESPCECMEDY